MMIMGGGIISWLQGVVADKTNIHVSYFIGVLCFAYLAFFAIYVTRLLKKQGIQFDNQIASAH
jgi:FHS family L-fucose permease-like MFS transporter